MKVENYLTKEEISEIKGKNLHELQELISKISSPVDATPEDELLSSPSFAKAHMGVIYLYLSNLRMEVYEKKPDSPRIKELESMIDTSKHCFNGLQTLEERSYKYFDYKSSYIDAQQKILELEKLVQELQKIIEGLINCLE